ncbi:hypothetical protein Tco_1370597 [Tanacetum coccineum]
MEALISTRSPPRNEYAMDKEVADQVNRPQEKTWIVIDDEDTMMMNALLLDQNMMTFQSKIKGDGFNNGYTDNAHIPKVSTTTWFKPIPESERPATPKPEWTIPPNDFPEPEHNWANAYASTFKVREKQASKE